MAQFVRVSGYGQDELDEARQAGLKDFVDESNYYLYPKLEGSVPASTTYHIFQQKTFDKDCIVTVLLGVPTTVTGEIECTMTAESGDCEPIATNVSTLPFSFNASTRMIVRVLPYRVTAGSVLTLDVRNASGVSAFVNLHYTVNGVGISES